jgi:hypothetical protein
MNATGSHWLLLIISLPTAGATGRMRNWRALKALGCGSLRDGVYVLPASECHEQSLGEVAQETIKEGGRAWLLPLTLRCADEEATFRALFDRVDPYAQLAAAISQTRKTLATLTPQDIARQVRKLRKDYETVRAIDFFPNEASLQAEAQWEDFVGTVNTVLSPGEPHPADGTIRRLDPAEYRQRLWATRRKMWVDRVASAWLVRRFIDREARFLWLASPADCPPDALGFDFDGATFTHVGERVTFEVLLASFGLEDDSGLARLAQLVHALDVGGVTLPEAQGFEAIMSGARQRLDDDDRLLDEIGSVLDSLYAHFRQPG